MANWTDWQAHIGGVTPLPTATSWTSLLGLVHTTTLDPNDIEDRLDGTNCTIGALGETAMCTNLFPTKLTINSRPTVVFLLEVTMPLAKLLSDQCAHVILQFGTDLSVPLHTTDRSVLLSNG